MKSTPDKLQVHLEDRLAEAFDLVGYPSMSSGRAAKLMREMIKRGHTVTSLAVRKWLTGETHPTLEKLRDIAILGNTSTDWLISGKGLRIYSPLAQQLMTLMDQLSPEQIQALLVVAETFIKSATPPPPGE